MNIGAVKDLEFKDFVAFIEGDMGKTEWVTVFEFFEGRYSSINSGSFYAALIPIDHKDDVLKTSDWDLRIGSGRPGFIIDYEEGKQNSTYYRYGDNDGIEPLVHWHPGRRNIAASVEVSEEFRHYFDLAEIVREEGRFYVYVNDDGDEEDVIVISESKVDIKLKFLKEFLAVKQMCMAIYFEAMRFLPDTLEKEGMPRLDIVKNEGTYTYSLLTRNLSLKDSQSQGWILGKKVVSPGKKTNIHYGSREQMTGAKNLSLR